MALPVIILLLIAALSLIGIVHAILVYRRPSLPVSRNTKRRMLPVLGQDMQLLRRTCGQCHFFEPTGFEELRRLAPAGAEAAKWLSPLQMAAVEHDKRDAFDQQGQPVALGGPRWDEIGTCHKRPGVQTFPENQCEHWA